MWWCIYLFSVSATGGNWKNWSILGCVFLTLLFVPPNGSIDCKLWNFMTDWLLFLKFMRINFCKEIGRKIMHNTRFSNLFYLIHLGTESISSKKYPEYADYQKRVNRFIPWFPSASEKSDWLSYMYMFKIICGKMKR